MPGPARSKNETCAKKIEKGQTSAQCTCKRISRQPSSKKTSSLCPWEENRARKTQTCNTLDTTTDILCQSNSTSAWCLVLQRHLIKSGRRKDRNHRSVQDLQDTGPSSLFPPPLIATGHGLPRPEAFGKISPGRSGLHDPQDAFHDQTMLDRWTAFGRLLRQEGKQLLPALRSQCLQTCQRDWLHHPLRWKRMLGRPACHMAAFGDGLMPPPETRPAQTQHPSPVGFVPGLPQTVDFWQGQGAQLAFTLPFFCSWACNRMTTSKAWANSASVMKRYQAVQVRTSY